MIEEQIHNVRNAVNVNGINAATTNLINNRVTIIKNYAKYSVKVPCPKYEDLYCKLMGAAIRNSAKAYFLLNDEVVDRDQLS